MGPVLSSLPATPWGSVGVPEPDPSLRVKPTPNATRQALEIARAKNERRLFPVACTRLILIEAPSSAYRRGMLSLDNSHSHEEETSCDSTRNSTNFTVASTCMPAPCTFVS